VELSNLYSLFEERVRRYSGRNALFHRVDDSWVGKSWEDLDIEVHSFSSALLEFGFEAPGGVSILAGNIPEWTVADMGTIAIGGMGVGLYPSSSSEQCEYIINHSDSQFILVDYEHQLQKLSRINLGGTKAIVIVAKTDLSELGGVPVIAYRDFISAGRTALHRNIDSIQASGRGASSDETAILVYTSGTTGEPKGAMLSHEYVLNSVESLRLSVPIHDTDVAFSYLPACHVAERISGIYNRLYNGTTAYFIEDLSRLHEFMLEVRPTVFASLPRFFEKMYTAIVAKHGKEATREQVVGAFGGNMRLLTSGGAPLPMDIANFFAKADLPILQAYGLTENICVAFNTTEHLKYGTVGRPMPMCEVQTAEDGEILVKSPMLFSGYYKAPEKTREAFTDDGWLKTGDLGSIDSEGFLSITGRKKELIVLSSGKNVAPALVENLVKENHLISQCFLHGDGRSYCVALLTINLPEARGFIGSSAEVMEDEEILSNPTILESLRASVESANARLSSPEQIKRYRILFHDFTMERNEITPTMKLKRDIIEDNYRDLLEELYGSQDVTIS
jgi:long-chain acyl-CoA synthetase